MARNAIESDFRSSAAILWQNFQKYKNCVFIWNGDKCDRKWFSVIQDGRRRPFCEIKKKYILKLRIFLNLGESHACKWKRNCCNLSGVPLRTDWTTVSPRATCTPHQPMWGFLKTYFFWHFYMSKIRIRMLDDYNLPPEIDISTQRWHVLMRQNHDLSHNNSSHMPICSTLMDNISSQITIFTI